MRWSCCQSSHKTAFFPTPQEKSSDSAVQTIPHPVAKSSVIMEVSSCGNNNSKSNLFVTSPEPLVYFFTNFKPFENYICAQLNIHHEEVFNVFAGHRLFLCGIGTGGIGTVRHQLEENVS